MNDHEISLVRRMVQRGTHDAWCLEGTKRDGLEPRRERYSRRVRMKLQGGFNDQVQTVQHDAA
jgi:hypothetical protein